MELLVDAVQRHARALSALRRAHDGGAGRGALAHRSRPAARAHPPQQDGELRGRRRPASWRRWRSPPQRAPRSPARSDCSYAPRRGRPAARAAQRRGQAIARARGEDRLIPPSARPAASSTRRAAMIPPPRPLARAADGGSPTSASTSSTKPGSSDRASSGPDSTDRTAEPATARRARAARRSQSINSRSPPRGARAPRRRSERRTSAGQRDAAQHGGRSAQARTAARDGALPMITSGSMRRTASTSGRSTGPSGSTPAPRREVAEAPPSAA